MNTARGGVVLVLSAAAIGCSDSSHPPAPESPETTQAHVLAASQAAPTTLTARYEVRFLEDMIDHHMMAVMTAELCVDRAVHEDLRSLCEQIIATQSQEIEMMQDWLAEWYGVTHQPEMTPGAMKRIERLAALDGAEFEIEFMEMMIRHHGGAIKEAEQCLRRAYHQELVELCEDIIATQQAEIELMQEWLCEWCGLCS